ncbi:MULTISPECIES: hypothetical protein [Myxococcaceae]|nr:MULTISPECIES: hypothetical protein [Myxococcaceae]
MNLRRLIVLLAGATLTVSTCAPSTGRTVKAQEDMQHEGQVFNS